MLFVRLQSLAWASCLIVAPVAAQTVPPAPVGVSLSALGFVAARTSGELTGRIHWDAGSAGMGLWGGLGIRYDLGPEARSAALADLGVRLSTSGLSLRMGIQSELRPEWLPSRQPTGLTTAQADSLAQGLLRPTENGWEPIPVPPPRVRALVLGATADLVGILSWHRGGVALEVESGVPLQEGKPWLGATVAVPLLSQVALMGGVIHRSWMGEGSGSRRVILGLAWQSRLASGPPDHPPMNARRPPAATPTPALQVQRVPGAVRLRLLAAGAGRVELRSDLTGWQPRDLAPDGPGWWTITLDAPAGLHRLAVRCDAAEWEVPPGLVRAPDGFGGWVGLLYVE